MEGVTGIAAGDGVGEGVGLAGVRVGAGDGGADDRIGDAIFRDRAEVRIIDDRRLVDVGDRNGNSLGVGEGARPVVGDGDGDFVHTLFVLRSVGDS